MSRREAVGLGIGQRLLHSFAAQALLLMLFFPIACGVGHWLRGSVAARWTRWRFIVITSAAYVANHIFRLALGPLEWLMLFAFGCAYAAALVRSGSLWAAGFQPRCTLCSSR